MAGEELKICRLRSPASCADCYNEDNAAEPAHWLLNDVRVCLSHLLARLGWFLTREE